MATPEIQSFRIDRDDGPPLAFEGVLLANVNGLEQARTDFSGRTGCWQRLEIYRSGARALVCVRHRLPQRQGERADTAAEVVFDLAGIVAFFGGGPLARELYVRLYSRDGLNRTERVEGGPQS